MNALLRWLDHRTGYRRLVEETLYERVPGGARWRYVFGSMLVFAFVTQVVTGFFLWLWYSAGSQNAWESVYYIQYEVQGGWLLRGVHHFMAQAMVVLLPLHLLQVVLAGAYKPPREVNFWLGLILMLLTLALGLTGYLLPWDQKGYWATKVATELMSLAPGGKSLQRLVVGGSEYGHATLTRFFSLHAGLLPALMVGFLVLHISLFRRHGVTGPAKTDRPDEHFWPKQVLFDSVACLVLLLVVLGVVVWRQGAELGPPAEPTQSYGAARPEWYFLFLFQLLKKFDNEFIGAIVVPTLVMVFLFLMPFFGRVKMGHIVNVVVILILIAGAGYLTFEALYQDNYANWGPKSAATDEATDLQRERYQGSIDFVKSKKQAHEDFERVKELVEYNGIPREGVAALIENDSEIQGPRLFAQACASCHSYLDENGNGIAASEVSAPNLYGIGRQSWWAKILSADEETGYLSHDMFGKTAHTEGDMASFVTDDMGNIDDEQKQDLQALVDLLIYQAGLSDKTLTTEEIDRAKEMFENTWSCYACSDCHKLNDLGDLGSAPDLTDIYSEDWLYEFIANPNDERFYGDNNDRMPAFAEHMEAVDKNLMTETQIRLLARWLRGDDRNLIPKEESEE